MNSNSLDALRFQLDHLYLEMQTLPISSRRRFLGTCMDRAYLASQAHCRARASHVAVDYLGKVVQAIVSAAEDDEGGSEISDVTTKLNEVLEAEIGEDDGEHPGWLLLVLSTSHALRYFQSADFEDLRSAVGNAVQALKYVDDSYQTSFAEIQFQRDLIQRLSC